MLAHQVIRPCPLIRRALPALTPDGVNSEQDSGIGLGRVIHHPRGWQGQRAQQLWSCLTWTSERPGPGPLKTFWSRPWFREALWPRGIHWWAHCARGASTAQFFPDSWSVTLYYTSPFPAEREEECALTSIFFFLWTLKLQTVKNVSIKFHKV